MSAHRVEIGYLCRKGHFILYGSSSDDCCGTERLGGIYVEADDQAYPNLFKEALDKAVEDLSAYKGVDW